jgi:hypothetical protein
VASERRSRDLQEVHGEAIYRIIRGIVLSPAVADQLTHRALALVASSLADDADAGAVRLAAHRIAVRLAVRHQR